MNFTHIVGFAFILVFLVAFAYLIRAILRAPLCRCDNPSCGGGCLPPKP